MTDTNKKICFVIAPIGKPESETRKRSDQVLQHIIRPAVESCGYKAVRADKMDEPGMITNQIIRHVVDDPLVIADLTGQNANVFYELAIRHAIRKPLVQIINKVEDIPFDIITMRTILVDHQNPDSFEEAKTEIKNQIQSLEANSSRLENPISVALADRSGSNQLDEIMTQAQDYPLSTETDVESLKRYIDEPRYRIQLSDLIDNTVERVIEETSGEAFSANGDPDLTTELVTARVRGYEMACSTLLAMASIGGYYAKEEYYRVWQKALERLGSAPPSSGLDFWLKLQLYPTTLLLYALGLGAVEADQLRFLGRILGTTIHREHQKDMLAVEMLPPFCFFLDRRVMGILEGMERRKVPLNDWIHGALRPCAEHIIHHDNRYALVFDKLEILIALSYAHYKDKWSEWYWAPPGAFIHRDENRVEFFERLRNRSQQSETNPRS